MFGFKYINDSPIIDVASHPDLQGNANGPSLIKAPDWLPDAPGKYLLYFAHHEGQSIRLASSDRLDGPWEISPVNPVELRDSQFATSPPLETDLDPEAKAYLDKGDDSNIPHIASPDVWVDHESRQIRMYFHGRLQNGIQRTRLALSKNSFDFEVQKPLLGLPYFKVFRHQNWFYALAMPGQLYRSRDGLSNFETGPKITKESIRHHALLRHADSWYVFWTRVGDTPERILVSRLETNRDWLQWSMGEATELHRAVKAWEGGDLEPRPSQYGAIMQRVNQLRDPAIYQENGKIYLLYSIAGEQGVAIGELNPVNNQFNAGCTTV